MVKGKKYGWVGGSKMSGDASRIGSHIEKLEQQHGHVTAKIALEDARDPKSPLHDQAEWNDKKAAHEYRLAQMRKVLRAIVVTVEDDTPPVRAFWPVEDGEYHNVTAVMRSADWRESVVERAKKEARDWRARYANLRELVRVFKEIDELP